MPENLRTLRRKREIVGEIQQITRAMKLVSAAKLKRALTWREATQAYFSEVEVALALALANAGPGFSHPLLAERPVERIGLLLVAGDKGLCGAFNANVVGAAREFIGRQRARVQTMTVGTRTAEMARRARLNVTREFPAINERQRGADVQEIARHLFGVWQAGSYDAVHICHAQFISRMRTTPVVERVLPTKLPQVTVEPRPVIFEPDAAQLAGAILPQYVIARLFQALLSSAASEHSARLMAMSAATENAQEMLTQLTRHINRARQAQVTRELLDVVSGADALQVQR